MEQAAFILLGLSGVILIGGFVYAMSAQDTAEHQRREPVLYLSLMPMLISGVLFFASQALT